MHPNCQRALAENTTLKERAMCTVHFGSICTHIFTEQPLQNFLLSKKAMSTVHFGFTCTHIFTEEPLQNSILSKTAISTEHFGSMCTHIFTEEPLQNVLLSKKELWVQYILGPYVPTFSQNSPCRMSYSQRKNYEYSTLRVHMYPHFHRRALAELPTLKDSHEYSTFWVHMYPHSKREALTELTSPTSIYHRNSISFW